MDSRKRARVPKGTYLAMVTFAPLLCGCGHKDVSASVPPGHDARTEWRREQDCADPQWKAANLGLWYNVCATSTY